MALPQDGQNANGLTKVTEIPKGKELIFIDPTTNEGGIITLEDLTTQILKNLTSQTFALDQGNMTLLAALNQLNSNPKIRNDISIAQYADIAKANEYVYTGVEIVVPENTTIIAQIEAGYSNSESIGVIISKSKESCGISLVINGIEKYPTILTHVFTASSRQVTYYVWAKYKAVAQNRITVDGISIK